MDVAPPLRLLKQFRSLSEWRAWKAQNPWITDTKRVPLEAGFNTKWFGFIPPDQVRANNDAPMGPLWIVPRHRMLLDLILDLGLNPKTARIYAAEASSAWALAMRGRFPRFIGSEYRPEDPASIFPTQHQDVMCLTYDDGVFDLAVTQEVLEHVPDFPKALSELARVLRPGSTMLSTFPFAWEYEETIIKAKFVDGRIEHMTEPEYHTDPHRADGALVFQIPGWDSVATAKACGFSDAHWLLYVDTTAGIVGPHMAGLWCFVCRK